MSNTAEVLVRHDQKGTINPDSLFNILSLERTKLPFPELLRSFPLSTIPTLAQKATHRLGVPCSPDHVRWASQAFDIPVRSALSNRGHRGRGRLQKMAIKYLRNHLKRYGYPNDYGHAVFLLSHCGVDLWHFTGIIAIKERLRSSTRENFYTTLSRDVGLELWHLGRSVTLHMGMQKKMIETTRQADVCFADKAVLRIIPFESAAQLTVFDDGSGCIERTDQQQTGRRLESPGRVLTHLKGRRLALERQVQSIDQLLIELNP